MQYIFLLFIIMSTIIILKERKPETKVSKKCLHIDLFSHPKDEYNKWILIRSIQDWKQYIDVYGMPDFIHFGANLGLNRELGKFITEDIIYRDQLSNYSFIPKDFSFNINSSLRLFGDRFYMPLNEHMVSRELLAA